MHETVTRGKKQLWIYEISFQIYIPTLISKYEPKSGLSCKWFIHGPKRRKENQLLSLKHPCWLSSV